MTPARGKTQDSRFVSWSAAEVPWTIEYPPDLIEQIRAYACDGLLRLSHAGRDVGGVIFGTHGPEAIRILAWRPITCEYSNGDTLQLSHRDRLGLAVEFETARSNPELKDLRPVGWFVSHPRGAVAMTPEDLETFANFFPESWQVTLVIRPGELGVAGAGFFAREKDGSVRAEASYKYFVLAPAHARAAGARPAAPAAPVRNRMPELPPIALDAPEFETDPPLPSRERWLWAIPILLALGIAGWLLYQRQTPAPTTHLAFHVASSDGRTVQLEWNANSPAIGRARHGEIDVADGSKTEQVELTSDQLRSGKMSYAAQTGDVSFDMSVYPADSGPIHDSTRFIGPGIEPPVAAQPRVRSAPVAAPAPPLEQSASQQQVVELKAELAKERARADELQNLVRILETRLSIKPDTPRR